ncbi:hypothetical protein BJX63DRAFT_426345 [Aspergillus granulosus]|uniref:LysM domain-containing protein n=1 Tax=Aspergillus granulosus TaxID=176169 RepID=A0ABR4GT57_9EURO
MPSLKSAITLSLLPELLAARSIPLASAAYGDSCEAFASSWGISEEDLKSLNPGLDCANFDDFAAYCVLGDVTADDPSITSSTTTTVALTTTTEKSTTTETSAATTATGDFPSPTQPGLAADCGAWHKVTAGDQCDTIEAKYGITNAQFSSWNPYINDNYYICVHVAPKPQMPDIISECSKYHKVQSGEGCWAIDSAYGITLDQFRKWNLTIDASCSNLWVDYYVCVGV